MRRGPIRKEMQTARQLVRSAPAPDVAEFGKVKYWDARNRLAEAKGHDIPTCTQEFDAPPRRHRPGMAQEIAEQERNHALQSWGPCADQEAGQ